MIPSQDMYRHVTDDDPKLSDNEMWKAIEARLRSNDGLPGFTYKMEIGDYDIYVKTAWYKAKIVRIDVTLSQKGHKGKRRAASPSEESLEATRFDLAKASLETICQQASDMLQSGQVGIGHIVDEWMGSEMYPMGWCPQLPMANAEGEVGPSVVKGPIDAVAKLIKRRLPVWTQRMKMIQMDEIEGTIPVDKTDF